MKSEERFYCPIHLTPVNYFPISNEYSCNTCGVVRRLDLMTEKEATRMINDKPFDRMVEAGE